MQLSQNIIHFETLGCRLNQDETEGAARSFTLSGFKSDLAGVSAKTSENLDVILSVINTCTVTTKAEQKARRLIRLLLEKYPNAPVVVTGCYAELDAKEIRAIAPERISVLAGTCKFYLSALASGFKENIDSFLDTNGLIKASLLDDFFADVKANEKKFSLNSSSKLSPVNLRAPARALDTFSLYTPVFEKHSRASIKIQDGCNCSCSFCRIHLARGTSLSLEADDVLRRVRDLEERGVNEVVCTGVNLSQYSSFTSEGKKIDFTSLLELLVRNTERIKLRISSLYPQSVDERFCSVISSPRIQPFFHLSIQSGSDRILKAMNRPHDVTSVLHSVELLRSVKNSPFISSDIIAGFPGESEEDFVLTKELCDRINFAWIHAFPFSARPGTKAFSMTPKIPERVKDERVLYLTERAVAGKINYINEWQNKTVSAIVESPKDDGNVLHVVTENFLHAECIVSSEQKKALKGGMSVNVKVGNPKEDFIRAGKEIECSGEIIF